VSLLSGLRVVEGSAFVAAPLAGMTLAQLGADVIRFDAIGGGIDYHRWPVTADDVSLYWAGLNKQKRSIAINLADPRGRELATSLVVAPGPYAGLFVSNFPESGWLSDDRLRAHRSDLVYVSISGNPDGSTAVDYTINAASGIAYATGRPGDELPLNNALPAWDIATGFAAALALVAGERRRTRTGEGQLLRISLADVAFSMVATLGFLGEAELMCENRPKLGNDVYGAFGHDFATRDGRRVVVMGISASQWRSLVHATGIAPSLPAIEQMLDVNLEREPGRYRARSMIAALLEPWFAARTLDEVAVCLDGAGACWGVYQHFTELLADPRVASNPLFQRVDHPGIGPLVTPGSPIRSSDPVDPAAAPRLGTQTDEILADVLGLTDLEIGRLHDDGLVAGPRES
jgi:2-methylfumaryl-CoA isomerase